MANIYSNHIDTFPDHKIDLTLVKKYRFKSLRRTSLYIGLVLLTINLLFSGFNLYSIVTGILLSFMVGVSVALVELFIFPRSFNKLNFSKVLVTKSLLYLFLLIIFIIPLSHLLSELYWLIQVFESNYIPRRTAPHTVRTDWRQFLQHPGTFLRTIFIYLIGCTGIVFINQINRTLGPGVLRKLLSGKYDYPVEEVRIFMFLDLKSSTSIAEQLDNITYSYFIRDIYHFVGEPILQTNGEIYQYVGDEVIISWPVRGVRHPPLPLECFWKIEKLLNDQHTYFEKKYGFFPQFKAGIHYGPVVATLVGDIKTELVYQGDVINTAARIQQQCNVLDQKILLSRSLKDILQLPPDKKFISLGPIRLKGKQNEVWLYTVG